MAKCEICGKEVRFGIKVSQPHIQAQRAARQSDRRRKADPHLRLHPLSSFRQGNPRYLIEVITAKSR